MEQQDFFRDTWAEINLDAIFHNVNSIKAAIPENTKMLVAVKANAYGHGDIQVANTALEAGAHGLLVAFLDEALRLREKGITAPILVLGAMRPRDAVLAARHHISVTVFQLEWLKEAADYLTSASPPLQVHAKCDTGMGRIGIRDEEELIAIEKEILHHHAFQLEGIYTHFATADQINEEYYQQQRSRFISFLQCLENIPPYIHAANSAAALVHQDAFFNTVRIGISMYGLTPSEEIAPNLPFERQEAFSLHTQLIHVKQIKAGEKIGYGAEYTANTDEWIGTIPIGYADGWIRKLRGIEVLTSGEWTPIVGKICMDQCMVKLPYSMPVGTRVTLIGRQGSHSRTVDDVAKKLETINYEVVCMISSRVPRLFVKHGKYLHTHHEKNVEKRKKYCN